MKSFLEAESIFSRVNAIKRIFCEGGWWMPHLGLEHSPIPTRIQRGPSSKPSLRLALAAVFSFSLLGFIATAAQRPVPNASFEVPEIEFAGPDLGSWQKAPKPAWYTGEGEFQWDNLMGQFVNPTNGAPGYIDNMDGNQAAFLFALPEVGIYQDYNSMSGTNGTPSREMISRFKVGRYYTLTVGVLGGGGGMSNGVPLELSLYYRDSSSNLVSVTTSVITNSQELFPTNTHFTDFQVRTPVVRPGDPWADNHIGIRLASTVSFELRGGYWDVDNVRLTENILPNGSFELPSITDVASPAMDHWHKSPQPAWYDPSGSFPWEALMGQFPNTPHGASNHIDSVEGKQAAFLFALPEVAISQEAAIPERRHPSILILQLNSNRAIRTH